MSKTRLGELQHAIMSLLWQQGEATVAEVHSALLAERGLALTTIATILTKMERKGVVDHRTEGRRYVYRPLVTEDEVRRTMIGEVADRLFSGDVSALVLHLLDEHDVDLDELAVLKAQIKAREAADLRADESDRPSASDPPQNDS